MFENVEVPEGGFSTILADPPWKFKVRSDKGMSRSAENHYPCMSIPEIAAMPVKTMAAKDCTLLMWVTDPFLALGMDVIKSWGFKFKTVGFQWAKLHPKQASQMFLTEALRVAPVGVVAPFDYTQLIWASLIGFFVWGELPHPATVIGAGIVAASGIYILYRELRVLRAG